MSDINSRLTSGKRYEVERNKAVLERLIDIIKLIGKRGLSYRGARDAEAAYTLNDSSLDHGNFLEIVMLLSKYDPVFKEHTDRAIYKSQKSKNRQTVSRPGRPGGLVTFLSKTNVDYIIEIIGSLMKTTIAENIRKAPFFTIQIDFTQDINVHDQLAIIIRFVTDDIDEKLLAIIDCKSGKDVKNCIGSSTDGASNMRGQYNGFSSCLNKESPEQVHVWCYAHILDLVMIDTTQVCNESTTLFGLLNSIAVFVRESYLRMNKWHENSKYKFISCIGDTRWWAKDRCLAKVFGTYLNPNECLYVEIIQTLNEIYESNGFAQDVRFKAKCFIDGLLKYETTKRMNIVHAFSMVKTTISTLQSKARDFNHIKDLTRTFIEWANCQIDDVELEYNIEEKFPMKRIKKKKKMPGEIPNWPKRIQKL
ncbi:zinc finger MYM-type protein 1-like [Acyrthosiphon pisum]|uniref:Zinc finger MYM-type protein 1-like n=1 Tax=Acyrthosiphon pisum TaxID=7029 RepID=A0A8R1X0H8_ACYPI|nr:zinc finger MYM-type protein 1-like [Acyrthosiphon pisum]|eukprot:XP_008178665.1 PREDICTED: zinc finger MYM-type protein 1-like [Acyrthosiphon pisum]